MMACGICALCGADLADDGSRVCDCQRAGARARGGRATARVVSLSAVLRRMGACQEARDWVRSTRNERFVATWHACPKRAWQWWLMHKVSDRISRDAFLRSASAGRVMSARVMERAILAWWEAQS